MLWVYGLSNHKRIEDQYERMQRLDRQISDIVDRLSTQDMRLREQLYEIKKEKYDGKHTKSFKIPTL